MHVCPAPCPCRSCRPSTSTRSKAGGATGVAGEQGQQASTGAIGSAQEQGQQRSTGATGSGAAVKFDCASAGSQQALSAWNCAQCGKAYALASVVAYLQADNTFVTEDNPNFKAAIALVKEGVEPLWSNRFSATKTIAQRLVCIHCCEKLHDAVYTKDGKPTPRWDKLRKRSQGCVSKSSTEHILEQVNKQARAGADNLPMVDVKDVFGGLEAHDAAKKGRDWIEWLGPLCTFHYGCGYCSSFPTKSSSWYRAIKKTKPLAEGMSSLGDKTGYWYCAASHCVKRWSWAVGGRRRLLVIGSEDMISRGIYYFAYVEKVNSECENKINRLKSLTMLQMIGSRIITSEVICSVIDEVNTMTEKKLCKGVKEITTRVSGDVSDLDCQLYCEHKSLSLPKPGIVFKTIDLQGRTDVPTFVDDELSEFLDSLASFMNVDMLSASDLKPAERTTQRSILSSPAYLSAIVRMMAICDYVVPPASSSSAEVLGA